MASTRIRTICIAIHRYLGLATLLFLFLAAVTGCLLCFDQRIDAMLNPDLFASTSPAGSPVAAVAAFEAAHPALRVTSFPLNPDVGRTLDVMVAPRDPKVVAGFDQAFLDPRDGRLVGTRQTGPGWDRRHIVQGIFEFHYTLLAGTFGRWLMGIAALGWLIGNGVGFYLTLPQGAGFWRKWKKAFAVRTDKSLRLFLYDLHQASGLWLFAGVMLLAFTSVCMNFFDEAFTPAVQAVSPARPSPFDTPAPANPSAPRIGFERAVRDATRLAADRRLGWRAAFAGYLSDRNLYSVSFTPSGRVAYRGLGPVSYYLDGATGRFVYADDPYADSTGRKLSRALYPVHSGEVVGVFGIGVVFLLGLATAEMSVTGFYTWWKKRQSRIVMEKAKAAARRAG